MKLKDIQPKTAITIGRKKWNNYKGRQEKLQVGTTLKQYPKKSLHLVNKIPDPDSANSYDNNFDFKDARIPIEKQDEININDKIKFLD